VVGREAGEHERVESGLTTFLTLDDNETGNQRKIVSRRCWNMNVGVWKREEMLFSMYGVFGRASFLITIIPRFSAVLHFLGSSSPCGHCTAFLLSYLSSLWLDSGSSLHPWWNLRGIKHRQVSTALFGHVYHPSRLRLTCSGSLHLLQSLFKALYSPTICCTVSDLPGS
jgi:hypothetical protein